MKRILVLEDDAALLAGICLALKNDTATPVPCASLREARAACQSAAFDLLVLDVNLPDGSGLDFLRETRRHSSVPALILTANDMELDIVTALENGADDYITKPFSLAVLRARVKVQLRHGAAAAGFVFAVGPYLFDFDALTFSKNGQSIELSRTEQKLLRLLVSNRGQTLPRALLLERIWGDEAFVDENALSVSIKRLRDKLEDATHISTVYGVGYTWKE